MASRREIIDKIEKLYALASGGAAPSEAKAAIALAEKLAKKYNISDSEINKHTYTRGTSKQRTSERHHEEPSRQQQRQSYNEGWYRWQYQREGYTNSHRDDWEDFRYSQQHIDPGFVRADINRETEKAYLLNVYLDPAKYPWARVMKIVVTSWYPKSQVIAEINGVFLLNKDLLTRNLKNNIPWLLKNHSVFKNYKGEIVFHYMDGLR